MKSGGQVHVKEVVFSLLHVPPFVHRLGWHGTAESDGECVVIHQQKGLKHKMDSPTAYSELSLIKWSH